MTARSVTTTGSAVSAAVQQSAASVAEIVIASAADSSTSVSWGTSTREQIGQSFDAIGPVVAIDVYFSGKNGTPTDGVFVEVAESIDGTAISSSPVLAASALVVGLNRFPLSPVIEAGTYWFRVSRTGPLDDVNNFRHPPSTRLAYADGNYYELAGSWTSLPDMDMRFQAVSAVSSPFVSGSASLNAVLITGAR